MEDFPIWLKLVIWLVVGATVAYAVGAAIYTAMMGKYRRLSTSSNRYSRATRVVESRTPFTGTIWSHAKITSMGSLLILFSHFPMRLVLYAILEALALQAIVVTIMNDGPEIFQEDGPIERVHFGLLIACAVVFLWNRRGNSAYPSLLLFCSLLALIAALRELDHYSEVMLFKGAYKYPGGVIGALALYHLGKDRQKLRKEISAFIKEPAFFFLAFGFFLAAILAQVLGQAELWHALIETSPARTVKRTFEETLETVGYLTLFFGAIETFSVNGIKSKRNS